jgi:hypothetical protein
LESWGCEYLDFLNVQEFKQEKYKPSFIEIPVSLISKMLDQHTFSNMKINDAKYIEQLKTDIVKNGLLQPGQITVGTNGATLSDGNHRFAACQELNYHTFPVKLFKSNNPIKMGGIKSGEFIMELLGILNDT